MNDKTSIDQGSPVDLPPNPSELTTWAIQLYPYAPSGHCFQDQMVNAIRMAMFAWEQAVHQCRSPEQKNKDLRLLLEHHYCKTLVDPADHDDISTAIGYLRVEHKLRYKTAAGLKEALMRYNIQIHPGARLNTDLVTGESIPIGEYVLKWDLDRFAKSLRDEKAAAQRSWRESKS